MANRSVSTIIGSSEYTFSLSNEGNISSCGHSTLGIHGHKEATVFPFKIIPTVKNIKSIAMRYHCVCLDEEGNVFTFGNNLYGQLGSKNLTKDYTHKPQKVNLPPCKEVSCGDFFTICLSLDGLVYSFGDNYNGQLGLGSEENFNFPQQIESLKDVEFIECGGNFVFCKTQDHGVYCWGQNNYGSLGMGTRDDQKSPVQCSSLSNETIIDIKCGYNHTLVLNSNQDVLSCGDNFLGQLGIEIDVDFASSFQKIENLSEIIKIGCGSSHSLCIDINNDLYVFGKNSEGQLGLGDTDNRNKPVKHPSLSNIIDISKGGNNTFVKTSNNEIYAFGYSRYSQ